MTMINSESMILVREVQERVFVSPRFSVMQRRPTADVLATRAGHDAASRASGRRASRSDTSHVVIGVINWELVSNRGRRRDLLRRILKFLHTIGAIGLTGSVASLFVLLRVAPPPASLAGYAVMRGAMGAIATWIFLPSLALTLVAGLFAMTLTPGYQDAGWAWLKLATGGLIFEAFVRVQGSMQEEAERSTKALAGQVDPARPGESLGAEQVTLGVLLAVATAKVVLGIWRPRLTRPPD